MLLLVLLAALCQTPVALLSELDKSFGRKQGDIAELADEAEVGGEEPISNAKQNWIVKQALLAAAKRRNLSWFASAEVNRAKHAHTLRPRPHAVAV